MTETSNWTIGLNDTLDEAVSSGYTPFQATLIGISAGLLSLVTITGNLMVMISFKMDKQLQTISNYFLFSLAVADMIIGMISMPLFTLFIIQQEWNLGKVICDSWLSIDYLASNASVLNLLVISFDRYFSVTRPLTYRARRTTKKAALMIFAAWGISAVVWPPWIIAWPYIEGERTIPDNDCYIQFIYSNEYMSIVTVMIAFFIPVTIMIWLYVRVWWETVKRQRELVHLQAGKKAPSKRSNSSDVTMDDISSKSGCRGWRFNHSTTGVGVGGAESTSVIERSKAKEDVTYVPTAAITHNQQDMEKSLWKRVLSRLYTSISVKSTESGSMRPSSALEEASSDGGYLTPKSMDTPVQYGSKYSSMATIRDPYSCRNPILKKSPSVEGRLSKYQSHHPMWKLPPQQQQSRNPRPNIANSPSNDDKLDDESNGIYTIVIQFPSSRGDSKSKRNSKDLDDKIPKRVPSIKMLPEDISKEQMRMYPRSLPIVRRFNTISTDESTSILPYNEAASSLKLTSESHLRMANPRTAYETSILSSKERLKPTASYGDQVDNNPHSISRSSSQHLQATSMLSVASSGVKRPLVTTTTTIKSKKTSSEKKQDSKAAKTLSAILLAFIVTWTPYSVLVVINALLGKEAADTYIPSILWEFSYYLCYINSTVNPVLYALCNAAFRRTYVRILTCRWGSRTRQPINRYYYG